MNAPDAMRFDTGLRPHDVDPARPRPVQSPWGTLALYSIAGEILCTQAFCPHLEGPLFHLSRRARQLAALEPGPAAAERAVLAGFGFEE